MNKLIIVAIASFSTSIASAGNIQWGKLNPTYANECGSCHVPFPARLLGRGEWQQITSRLDKHFGVDASVDDKSLAEINAYLQQTGSSKARTQVAGDKLPRITESAWFVKEHREIAPSYWKKANIKSPSNCGACHGGAEQGHMSEHDLKMQR